MAKAHHIVFANEKGGTGKSTTAVHVAIALAARGARVSCLDLDSRQRTLYRYLEPGELLHKVPDHAVFHAFWADARSDSFQPPARIQALRASKSR